MERVWGALEITFDVMVEFAMGGENYQARSGNSWRDIKTRNEILKVRSELIYTFRVMDRTEANLEPRDRWHEIIG